MDEKKKRGNNFTEQDCLLLSELMGEVDQRLKMSNHQIIKSRFTQGITSESKHNVWKKVCESYNSRATMPRTVSILQKKWENLVSKHRVLYSDNKRERELTGGGPATKPLSLVTNCVLDVIGRDCVSITGAVDAHFDTSWLLVQNDHNDDHSFQLMSSPNAEEDDRRLTTPSHRLTTPSHMLTTPSRVSPTPSSVKRKPCQCLVDDEMVQLKKQKMKLQIKLLQRQLGEE